MKNVFKFFKIVIGLFVISLFAGCEVGLGSALDLEAPEITVTSPDTLSNVGKHVTIEGTCKDNVGVTEVEVTDRLSGKLYGKAVISGDKWTIDLTLEEGEVELLCTAKDASNNSSVKSSKTLMLLVDETAPEGKSWYVDRGDGVQVELMTKEELNALDTGLAKNKHIPQNEQFTVYGRFYDAMSIDTITLIISEDDIPIVSKTVTAENKGDGNFIGDGKSIYAPSWTFTHDELVAGKSTMAEGKHILKLSYYSSDEHLNSATRSVKYFMWYPESDKPGIQQSGTVVDEHGVETLSVNVGSSIPLHFFDDDELEEVYYDFIPKATFDSKGYTVENIPSKKSDLSKKFSSSDLSGRSDWPLQVSAGDETGVFYLLAYAADKNTRVAGRTKKESAKIIKTTVADSSNPLLIMSSPEENSIPTIKSGSEFEFAGFSYDTSGTKQIRIAYIPINGIYNTPAKREERAKALFDAYANKTETIRESTGEIVKTYKFPISKNKETGETWFKEEFSITFDVLKDFGDEAKSLKFFEILLEDTDGNKVYKQFNVAADNIAPEISISAPSDNMVVCDYRHDDLVLRYKAVKSTGLGIDKTKYKIVRKDFEEDKPNPIVWTIANGGLTVDGDYVEATISKDILKNWAEGLNGFKTDTSPVFTFYGVDVLGNEASDRRTVVLSPLPVLESISVDKISGTYPAGKTPLTFQAKFSDSVKVTGFPRLKLSGIKPDNVDYYANYTSGSGTDTLTFVWPEIPVGVYTDGGEILSCALDKIDLNGGTIVTGTQGSGNATINFVNEKNFWDSKDETVNTIKREIKLDGIAPKITDITASVENVVKNDDGYFYVNENREIVLSLKFSEKVLVSGNPVVTAGGFKFNFQSLDNNVVKFAHKVAAGENGEVICDLASCISDSTAIKDEAGNSMDAGTDTIKPKVILDTTVPRTPTVKDLPIDSSTGKPKRIYNKAPTFTVEQDSLDTDIAAIEHSINGGLSWDNAAITKSGSYIIVARTKDKAGNVSRLTKGIEIILNDTFPSVDEISIAKTKGKYKKGVEVEFKVFLHDVVEPFNATDEEGNPTAYLKFSDLDSKNEKTVPVIDSAERTNKLVFKYTIADGDDYKGVRISGVNLGSIQDKYSNTSSEETAATIKAFIEDTNGSCYRSDLVFDGSSPYIKSYKLGTTSYNYPESAFTTEDEKVADCSNNAFTITLQFNENIVKESGTIILQRKGNWAIPAVMTSEEFSKYYNKMSVENREKMMITNSGSGNIIDEKLHDLTGMPLGPYQKITHGLKKSGTKAVPDLDTKFVLAYDLGLYDNPAGKTTVSDIREALKSVDYDKHTIEVNTSRVALSSSRPEDKDHENDTDVLTISFADVIEPGEEWELIIPETAFHDETGNSFAGLKSVESTGTQKTFALWSRGAAVPVVRVNRYSHGRGAYGLNGNTETLITGWTKNNATSYEKNSGSNLAPIGYTYARIDCESRGAEIYYQILNGGTANVDSNISSADKDAKSNESSDYNAQIADIDMSSLTVTTDVIKYTEQVKVGNTTSAKTRYMESRKDYITAYATKNGDKSAAGYEGIFKTVIIFFKSNTKNQINVQGGTAAAGEPSICGFPLRDATNDNRFSKNAYYFELNDQNYFAWVSYDIISTNFAILQHRSNYSSNYGKNSYGGIVYLHNFSTWE